MRRSAAPSSRMANIRPALKKPRLDSDENVTSPAPVAPAVPSPTDAAATSTSTTTTLSSPSSSAATAKPARVAPRSAFLSSFRQPLAIQKATSASAASSASRVPSTAVAKATISLPSSMGKRPELQDDDGSEKPRYYRCMWCKASNKKHKKWESDAILVVRGRTATLQDLEGKELGKTRNYSAKELSRLVDGESIFVSSKEVEVGARIKNEDYDSGKCFRQVGSSVDSSAPIKAKGPTKAMTKFKSHAAEGREAEPKVNQQTMQPRHDPASSNAIVMRRVTATQARNAGFANSKIIDVVVDPYLGDKLRPHQIAGVQFLYECVMGLRDFDGRGAILADEMGLGKTIQCISLVWTMLKQTPFAGTAPLAKRVIIVTPSSLVKNWQREIKKWLGNERLRVFGVSTAAGSRVEDYLGTAVYPVLLISYEMLRQTIGVLSKIQFDLVICDEGHRVKNEDAKVSKALRSLSTLRRIVLSGTPLQNDLGEFFAVVDFCNPGIVGSSASFRRVYEAPIVQSRQTDATDEQKRLGEARALELNRLVGLFVLRRTAQVNKKYLPPKTEYVIFCRPSDLQLSVYDKVVKSPVLRQCLADSGGSGVGAGHHLQCITGLKKICNDPSLVHPKAIDARADQTGSSGSGERQLFEGIDALYPADYDPLDETHTSFSELSQHSGKLQVLMSLLARLRADTSERVVLVSNFTQTLDLLGRMCRDCDYPFLRLDGSTPTAKRQDLVNQFNASYSKTFIFLLSSKAGGVGLNLVGASRLVLFDIDWNPANDLQAMARIWRDGQQRNVHIYRFLTVGTIEEKIFQRQVTKMSLSGAIVDGGIGGDGKDEGGGGGGSSGGSGGKMTLQFSRDQLRNLFTLRTDTLSDTHDLLPCDCPGKQAPARIVAGVRMSTSGGGRVIPADMRRTKAGANSGAKDEMSQLLSWDHYQQPFKAETLDGLLHHVPSEWVSLVFRKTERPDVAADKADDESVIGVEEMEEKEKEDEEEKCDDEEENGGEQEEDEVDEDGDVKMQQDDGSELELELEE